MRKNAKKMKKMRKKSTKLTAELKNSGLDLRLKDRY
jgi:hypothetical protein